MYLFTRMVRLSPAHVQDGMDWGISVAEKVNQITSLNVGLWTPMLSAGLGTLSWGAAVESLGDLEDADAKLQADPMFTELVSRGPALTVGTIDDEVAQFIHNPESNIDATYVGVVRSALANGAFARGVAAGVEIAQRATALGGVPTAFLMSTTGTYAGCGWITSAPSLRDLERAEATINMNPEFIAYLDEEAKDCFLPGVTTQTIWRRVV